MTLENIIYLQAEDLINLDVPGSLVREVANPALTDGTGTLNPENGAVFGGGGDNTGPDGAFDDYGLRKNYTGDGYFDPNGGAGDKLSFSFDAEPGTYDITIRYAAQSGSRPIKLVVDGVDTAPLADASTGNWDTWETHTFQVTVGGEVGVTSSRTVVLNQTTSNGAPNIDAIAISNPGDVVSFASPEITSDPAFTIDENTTDVGQVLADDLDGNGVTYDLTGADSDKVSIDAEGNLTFNEEPDFENPTDDGGDGTYDVTVEVTGDGETVTQDITITVSDVVQELPAPTIDPIVLQAEDALIASGNDDVLETIARTQESFPETGNGKDGFGLWLGYGGTGYIDFNSDGAGIAGEQAITLSVSVDNAGLYDMHVRFLSANSNRPLDVGVNGVVQAAEAPFVGTGFAANAWVVREPITLALEAGLNTITLAIPSEVNNGPNIDSVAITTVGDAAPGFPVANTAPTIDAVPTDVSIDENTTDVATIPVSDDGQGAVEFALGGADEALFEIDDQGNLSFVDALDFETAMVDEDGDSVYGVRRGLE